MGGLVLAALPMVAPMIGGSLGTAMTVAGTALSLVGAVQDYQSGKAQAKSVMQTAEANADIKRQEAGQEIARSQRAAKEERRMGDLAASRAIALASKSGGATDPTVIEKVADLAGEGEYNALAAMYRGEEAARGLEYGADLDVYQGSVEAKQIKREAKNNLIKSLAGTAMSAGTSLANKYGQIGTGGKFGKFGTTKGGKYGGGFGYYGKGNTRIDWKTT